MSIAVLTQESLVEELFLEGQPWLTRRTPSGRVSTWDKPQNRKNALRWAYEVYRRKTELGELEERWQVHDITDFTQPHLTNPEILGKSFRGLLNYKNFPQLMMEAFSTEFSDRFEQVLRPWMLQKFRHWDIQYKREMAQATCQRIAETKPVFFIGKQYFIGKNPFGHDYHGVLEQIQREYGLYSHWILLIQASIIIPDGTKPTHPLSVPYSVVRAKNSRYFWLTEDDVNKIAKQAKVDLTNLPNKRERLLELYLQGFTLEEIGEIFDVTRERARQILDNPKDSYLRLTPTERYVHQEMQEKVSILKLRALQKRGVDTSFNVYNNGITTKLYCRLIHLGSYHSTRQQIDIPTRV